MKALSCGSSASVRASKSSVYSTGDSLRTEIRRAASVNVRLCSSADGMERLPSKRLALWRGTDALAIFQRLARSGGGGSVRGTGQAGPTPSTGYTHNDARCIEI